MSGGDDTAARLERLEAAEGVRELLQRYTATVDALPPVERLADLFCEDAVLVNPDRHEGRAAILDYYGGVLGGLEWSRHHVVNSAIEVEGPGRARHRGAFFALLRRAGADSDLLVFGDYDDVAVRGEDGRWRFAVKGNHMAGTRTLADDSER
ncbi:MAG: nuclear transport factor 2 family protein [Solirubrobacterales bacterium]|nr:nuclear transport factor 2 family protein [Solirubrobacterales bacterium]